MHILSSELRLILLSSYVISADMWSVLEYKVMILHGRSESVELHVDVYHLRLAEPQNLAPLITGKSGMIIREITHIWLHSGYWRSLCPTKTATASDGFFQLWLDQMQG
ncbi:hypothetical protein LH51_11690 [Nitrincola sp. A-D6]|nr:hypothetical protein LH51_11690 [Nitrincola sp. A-D6]